MRIILNCSNLTSAGGIQVALSFIKECLEFPDNIYHIFLLKDISNQIVKSEFSNNFHFYPVKHSPSSLIHSFNTICKLKKFESEINPDCVFTVFGPSYWTPKCPHLLGYAQGYYLYPESPFFKRIKSFYRIKINLLKIAHRFFFIRNAKYFYVESEDAKQRLSSFLNISQKNIFAFSNTYHAIFNKPLNGNIVLPPKNKNEFRLITISSYYRHKNLEVIKAIIPLLKQIETKQFTFIVTIRQSIFEDIFKGFKKNIINLGPIPIEMCPEVYNESDALFLPTLVETFTASYPEAMKMQKPILTSDLSFAHDICGEAAEFFDPLSPEDIAIKIINLSNNIERQRDLIRKGNERLQYFETASSRARKLLEVCHEISKK